ncbi:hypothetical protein [Hymenobacter glacieicola]|uniref:Glycosyltransferase RgtA/B/C/D-like domain-containing protein n=1 Tax=Hymenobacter glacieicola TaxID=1562124 RepID=A0ABQ1WU06_9BACT|nr:hypothetical protein [Hymenobacter glacieicola]GGG43021.1 hypothetical protein GCM10011378_19230 [Hymenobacter glacieicola]
MMLRRLYVLGLPLLLLLGSGLLLGCYFETNDDLTIIELLRGTTAATPVTDLHLYFHGYAALWSRLYAAAPYQPWYACTLYGLLYLATVLVVAVLRRLLRGHAGRWWGLAFVVLFWGVAWLEHSFWFNYARVPVLLAGAGLLFAAQRAPARRALAVGLLAFGLAWLIRPSAALLGVVVALPGAWWLAGRRSLPLLVGVGAWAVVGALWLNLTWSPAAATFRRLDVLKSNLNDFQLAAPPLHPLAPRDSLGLAAARHWLLADSTLINEAFFARAAPFRPAYFLLHTAPGKLGSVLIQLARDYFPLLLLVLATWGLVYKQKAGGWQFWAAQLAYLGLTLGLGTVLKLPPRLALPLLDFWVLSNLVFLLRVPAAVLPRSAPQTLLLALVVAAVPYGYKTWHRSGVLAREQLRNRLERQPLLAGSAILSPDQRLALSAPQRGHELLHVRRTGRAKVVVTDALEETYKSESPFTEGHPPAREYSFVLAHGPRIMSVAGWQTLHPAQTVLLYYLTGTRNFTEALRRLGRRPDVAWVLTIEGAALLNRQLTLERRPGQPVMQLFPVEPGSKRQAKAQLYVMRTKFSQ